jgi:hypothetical protein
MRVKKSVLNRKIKAATKFLRKHPEASNATVNIFMKKKYNMGLSPNYIDGARKTLASESKPVPAKKPTNFGLPTATSERIVGLDAQLSAAGYGKVNSGVANVPAPKLVKCKDGTEVEAIKASLTFLSARGFDHGIKVEATGPDFIVIRK